MSDFYTHAVSQWLFPLHERLKGHSSTSRRLSLEHSQWQSPAELQSLQLTNLQKFLRLVEKNVPFYRDRFEQARFQVDAIQSVADLSRLPMLTKTDIRANTEQLKSTIAGPLSRYNTGGSSGEPLIFYMGKERKSHDVAAKWRATRWWGVDIGDPEMVVWGSPVELNAQDRMRRLRDGILRSHLLPAFEMSTQNLARFVDVIRATRPAMLFGYPSSLSLIARYALESGIRVDDLGVKVAFVTSEKLYDEQRAVIGEAFGCPVANGYGARDAGFIAHECPAGNLHISAEDLVVETICPDGTPAAWGDPGEIVVTHLATADFPFIRYRTGDIGVLSHDRCRCGRGLPILKDVQGRTTDFVVACNGTVMHGLALIYVIRDLPGVERFKIEQMSLQQTVVKVLAGPQFGLAEVARITHGFKARLGESVDIRVERVNTLANERSGKFRYVVSHVQAFGPPAEAAFHA